MFLASLSSYAQFHTPSIDGSIGSGEYGSHVNGENQNAVGSTTWYCTWDDTCVYFAASAGFDASNGDAMNVYIDVNPSSIVNNGTGKDTGAIYDQVEPRLPFSSDGFLFVKSGYIDKNTVAGGSWNSVNGASSGIKDYVNTGSNIIEFYIRWDSLGLSGRPSSFNWLGYFSYDNMSGSGMFSQIPGNNPTGLTPDLVRYYTIENTDSGTADFPFANESYTHLGNSIYNFGSIDVYDFTLNTSGDTIERVAGDWAISGDLTVEDGVLDFKTIDNVLDIDGAVKVGSGGKIILSSISDSINVGGDFENNGYFEQNGSMLILDGETLQTLSGTLDNALGDTNNLSLLAIRNTNGVALNSDLFIKHSTSGNDSLLLDSGVLDVRTNTLLLDTNVYVSGGDSSSFVRDTSGNVRWYIKKDSTYKFPIGGLDFSPISVSLSTGTYGAGAYLEANVHEVKHPNNLSIDTFLHRYWTLDQSSITGFSADVKVEYPSKDVNGSNELDMYVGKYDAPVWSLGSKVTTLGEMTYTSATSFSDFTGGAPWALPVKEISCAFEEENEALRILWTVLEEENCNTYELYKIRGGVEDFLCLLPCSNLSNQVAQYNCIDGNIQSENHYIIKQYDMNGESESFGPFSYLTPKSQVDVKAFGGRLHISSIKGLQGIQLYDIQGRELLSLDKKQFSNEVSLPNYLKNQICIVTLTYVEKKHSVRVYLD